VLSRTEQARITGQASGPTKSSVWPPHGTPVVGVRLENPNPSSEIEHVLYPSQVDGLQMEVQLG
jgi:hypothetical protein